MMHCRRIGSLLSAYLDGELAEEDSEAVRVHLERCPHCRAEHQSLLETKQVLAALGRRTPRADLERLLQTEVSEVARQVANYPISPRTFAAALLTLIGVWAATLQLGRHDDRHGPPLPEGAYHPFVEGRWVQVTGAVVTGPNSVTLLVTETAGAPPRIPMPVPMSCCTQSSAPVSLVPAGFGTAPVSLRPAAFHPTNDFLERR